MAYWYNVITNEVQTDENRDRDENVMGPYATEAEAQNAIASARERTEAWDEEDRREKERETGEHVERDDIIP